ncbi:hypothetical protein [Jeotgalibacillus soli]|uniref:Uncharacterized protein n=1 Tax=Jeotgalibacillus soli TaxID=889306 RepID=A0A0C2VLF4_9BACL|nr:hypothetical protein [Jeotgalibacillus soli]KIL45296.1 hypothetical protein KP78_28400 [Jeotgalibacillus soli]
MLQFWFEYEIPSINKKGDWSYNGLTEEDARKGVQERIADFEMVEVEDVYVGNVKRTSNAKDSFYECEGCT